MGLGIGSPAGEPQIWYGDTPYIVLGRIFANSESAGTATARFRVYMPDSRVRVKVSVLYVRDPNQASTVLVSNLGATLYLGEEEHDHAFGGDRLCTDILTDSSGAVIHQSAPLPIPEDRGLEGFSQEFVSAADSILGIFTTSNNSGGEVAVAGPLGQWVLQVRYQPDGQRLCDADWEWLKRKCHATLLGGAFRLGA